VRGPGKILLALPTFRLRILPMIKRALSAVAGFLGCCLPLSGLQAQMPGQIPFGGTSLDRALLPVQPFTLDGQQRFSFASLSWQAPVSFLPSFSPKEPRSVSPSTFADSKNPLDNTVELRARDRVYVGGQIGFLYGSSTGKYGGSFESGYVIGEIGNDYFHLTVGTSYSKSNGSGPNWHTSQLR
jgi:hypothetical protein